MPEKDGLWFFHCAICGGYFYLPIEIHLEAVRCANEEAKALELKSKGEYLEMCLPCKNKFAS